MASAAAGRRRPAAAALLATGVALGAVAGSPGVALLSGAAAGIAGAAAPLSARLAGAWWPASRAGSRRAAARRAEAAELEGLTPTELGEPVLPDVRRFGGREVRRAVPEHRVPAELARIHQKAVRKAMQGFGVGLRRATVLLPTGLGDGGVGSKVVLESYRLRRGEFRAAVFMPEAMLDQVEHNQHNNRKQ